MIFPAQPKYLVRRERRVGYHGRATGSETVAGVEMRTFWWVVHHDIPQNGVDWRDQKRSSFPERTVGKRSRLFLPGQALGGSGMKAGHVSSPKWRNCSQRVLKGYNVISGVVRKAITHA